MELDGSAVLVTGAGSGIGRATALALGRAGARVVVTDIDNTGGNKTVEEVRAGGAEAVFVRVDVSQADQVAAAVGTAVDTYGRLDGAYNNAGWEGPTAPMPDYEDADWDRLMSINLKGMWNCLKEELRVMEGGAIVNCSSVAGLIGFAGSSGYVASKHGVIGLTRTAALEGAPKGIRVNAVCPGAIDTPMLRRAFEANPELEAGVTALHPLGRIGKPEEVAEAVLWLLSHRSSFVTGQALAIDGGWTTQ